MCVTQVAFWYFRTRNLLANVTTNERHNLRRYPHFRAADGTVVNPFDRGTAANCVYYFCTPCAAVPSGGEAAVGVEAEQRGRRGERQQPLLS